MQLKINGHLAIDFKLSEVEPGITQFLIQKTDYGTNILSSQEYYFDHEEINQLINYLQTYMDEKNGKV